MLNLARSLFPDDSDLMLALKELLKSRQLTKLMKEKIKEAIDDLEKFSDSQKMRSGMNVGQLARNFSTEGGNQPLTAKELRSGYLRFLKLDLPCSYIYNDWIEQYGFNNRLRMLAFMMSALIIDIKALVPGIHYEEFGPLSEKLSDTRVIHTMDQKLLQRFSNLSFLNECIKKI
ncbi:type III secretion system gatekeeper subunit SctW [Pantoea sp. LMR881]|uniref:type III secretion system gatekeeper subunit SctW n=1 Tax=Pantoea sp. LMR881 TaxID=3014336 RepID=UPI0022AF2716|nr:type III secretion system gatekeeper subunit SctW [Pantoea sp. LMR881]MCZ4057960.1 type III secretion system gatekeeper subunit SctW [Pantoea sp. LMR881]